MDTKNISKLNTSEINTNINDNKNIELNTSVNINTDYSQKHLNQIHSYNTDLKNKLDKDIPVKNEVNNLTDLTEELPQNDVKTGVRELFDNNLIISRLGSLRESERNRDINIDTNVQIPVVMQNNQGNQDNQDETRKNRLESIIKKLKECYNTNQKEFAKGGTASFMGVANLLLRVNNSQDMSADEMEDTIAELKRAVEVYFETHATKRKTKKGIRRIEIMEGIESILYRPEGNAFLDVFVHIHSDYLFKKKTDTPDNKLRGRLIAGIHRDGTGDKCLMREARDNSYLWEGTPDECMDRFLSEIMNIRTSPVMLTPEYIYSHKIETLETLRLIQAFDNIREIAGEPDQENDKLRGVYNNALSKLSKKDRKKFDDIADRLHKLRIYYACVISSNGITMNGINHEINVMKDYITNTGTDGIFQLSVSEMKLKSRLLKKELLEDIPKNEQLMDTLEYKRHASEEEQRHMTRKTVNTYKEEVKQREQIELDFLKKADAYRTWYLNKNGHDDSGDYENRVKIGRTLVLGFLHNPDIKRRELSKLDGQGLTDKEKKHHENVLNYAETGRKDLGNMIAEGLFGTPEQLKELIIYLAKNINTTQEESLTGQEKQVFYLTLKKTLNSMTAILGEKNLSKADREYIAICTKVGKSRDESLQEFYCENPLYFLQKGSLVDVKGDLIEKEPGLSLRVKPAGLYRKLGKSWEDTLEAIKQFYEEYVSVVLNPEQLETPYIGINSNKIRHCMDLLHALPYVNAWVEKNQFRFKIDQYTFDEYLKEKGIVFPYKMIGKNGKEYIIEYNDLTEVNSLMYKRLSLLCRNACIVGVDNYSDDLDIFGRSDKEKNRLNSELKDITDKTDTTDRGYKVENPTVTKVKAVNRIFSTIFLSNCKDSFRKSHQENISKDIFLESAHLNESTELFEQIEKNFYEKYILKPDMKRIKEYHEQSEKYLGTLTPQQREIIDEMPDVITKKDITDMEAGKYNKKYYLFYDIDEKTVDKIMTSGTQEDKAYLYHFAFYKQSDTGCDTKYYEKITDKLNEEYKEVFSKFCKGKGKERDELKKMYFSRYICQAGEMGRLLKNAGKFLALVPGEITDSAEQLMFAAMLFNNTSNIFIYSETMSAYAVSGSIKYEAWSKAHMREFDQSMPMMFYAVFLGGKDKFDQLLSFYGVEDKETRKNCKDRVLKYLNGSNINNVMNKYFTMHQSFFSKEWKASKQNHEEKDNK